MHTAIVASATAVAALAGQVPAPAPPPAPCQGPEHRQFDFWIGHWDVYGPAGKKVGENLIEAFANGCGLAEHWTGSGGVTCQRAAVVAGVRRWGKDLDSGVRWEVP